jgi:hypothetical protein
MKRALVCFIVIAAAGGALAENGSSNAQVCNAALAKDISTTLTSQQQDLDFISLVDETTFKESKDKGTFGVNVPLADDLLKASGSWEQWQQNKTTYFHKIRISVTYEGFRFSALRNNFANCLSSMDPVRDGVLPTRYWPICLERTRR